MLITLQITINFDCVYNDNDFITPFNGNISFLGIQAQVA